MNKLELISVTPTITNPKGEKKRQAIAGAAESGQRDHRERECEEAGGYFDFSIHPQIEQDMGMPYPCGQRRQYAG